MKHRHEAPPMDESGDFSQPGPAASEMRATAPVFTSGEVNIDFAPLSHRHGEQFRAELACSRVTISRLQD
jgi:hypothetical protein